MKNYVNPKYCIAFANGSCSLGEACSFRHDVLKCSCERIFSSSAHEKHMETATHSKNLAALRAQLENGDNSTLQTIIGYRLEYTLSGGGKCKCQKICSGTIIPRGSLRFGMVAEIGGYNSFQWRHWGCVKKGLIKKLKGCFIEPSEIDGFEELQPADQAKVARAWEDGTVAKEDIPESAREPEKDKKTAAKKAKREVRKTKQESEKDTNRVFELTFVAESALTRELAHVAANEAREQTLAAAAEETQADMFKKEAAKHVAYGKVDDNHVPARSSENKEEGINPPHAREKQVDSTLHSENLAALQAQLKQGNNSESQRTFDICLKYATTTHVKCNGRKPCFNTIITPGELIFGVLRKAGQIMSWRHWGCVNKGMIKKVRRKFGEASKIPGFEELQLVDHAKVVKAWEDGAVAEEDIPESARDPKRDEKIAAKKARREARKAKKEAEKDVIREVGVPDMTAGILEVAPKNGERPEADTIASVSKWDREPKSVKMTTAFKISQKMPKVKAIYCVPYANGNCVRVEKCDLRHDIFKCSCGRILSLRVQPKHLLSRNHFERLSALQPEPDRMGSSELDTNGAIGPNTQEIAQYATEHQGYDDTFSLEQPQQLVKCVHCRKHVESANYELHVEEHHRQQRRAYLEAELQATEEDQQGITVSEREGVKFGIVDPNSTVEATISIQSSIPRIVIQACRMRSSTSNDEHGGRFSAYLQGRSRSLTPGKVRKVLVVVHPSFPGYFQDTLELVFKYESSTFVITRKVECTIGSKEDHDLLRAKAPYQRRRALKFNPSGPIVPSSSPPSRTNTPWLRKLPMFTPPVDIVEAVSTRKGDALAAIKQLMPLQFDIQTYSAWFQVLLYVEEEKMKSDLDEYAISAVEMKADNNRRYNLVVKGLAENRPSVLVGDHIFVSHAGSDDTLNSRTWYEGRVLEVHAQHVSIQFGHGFSAYRGSKFDVRFMLNRLTFRRMHGALTNKFNPPRLLFPVPEHIIKGVARVKVGNKASGIKPFYRPIGEDAEQMEAVTAILNQKPGSVPFVIFGPPGTGKTVTIVEAIRQLLVKDPTIHILACAPSNSAADNIAMKLLVLGPSQIFRLNALSRRVNAMPKTLLPITKVDGNSFAMPDVKQLAQYRVIVSTCYSAGVPGGLGLGSHFSHVFIDEAGQGREPEVMVAIKGNAHSNTNIILAGDVHQLGPVVHSPLAASLGLGTSYLHRLMQRSIYNLKTAQGITIIKLVKSFRSHPDIFHYSNVKFYESVLRSCGDPAITHSLIKYEELPAPKFPLIFHGIVGKDEREERSPSFFNIDEITLVKKYCVSLIGDKKNGIKPEHIGVITPYHAQRCKILDLLNKDVTLRGIKVGSVEEFQGQERRVVIISTVRSNKEYIESDIKRSLGFVANKQRLNVALTRAQALLIVIGNPMVLSLDPLWKGFLNFVHTRGGWTGKQIDWDPREPISPTKDCALERREIAEAHLEDTVARLKAMIISRHEDDGYGVEFAEDDEMGAFERPILREAE